MGLSALWTWFATALSLLLPFAPAAEKETFSGHLLNDQGQVIEGEFSIQWKGAQAERIRVILERRRPTQKGVVLMVDGEGRTRFPKTPAGLDAGDYRTLAEGSCATGDETCVADRLVACAAQLAQGSAELSTELYGEALHAAPEHAASLAALDALEPGARLRVLRRALGAHPKSPELVARVVALYPPGVLPSKGLRHVEWLELYVALERLGVHLITDPEAGTPGLVPAERKLGTYRHSKVWGRRDLLGFRSENLFLVTPLRDARAIRACLLRGELVCETLEQLFQGVEQRRSEGETTAEHDMLIVFLFESREEYLRLGENLRMRGMSGRHAFTAGFYSAQDRISRFFLPDRGDSYAELAKTLGHEITHQWIFEKCPGFTNEEAIGAILDGRVNLPGAWIVEGFASMMEELLYVDEAGTYDTLNPKADRLDTVANSKADQVLDWERLYELNYATVAQLDPRPYAPEVLVPISWFEGRVRIMSETNLFYAQAAASCHYLFTTDGGALRPKLLRFLVAYYSGDVAGVEFESAFGMEELELGQRVWKHAQAWGRRAAELRRG